jgi:hypothetical protein
MRCAALGTAGVSGHEAPAALADPGTARLPVGSWPSWSSSCSEPFAAIGSNPSPKPAPGTAAAAAAIGPLLPQQVRTPGGEGSTPPSGGEGSATSGGEGNTLPISDDLIEILSQVGSAARAALAMILISKKLL